MSYGTKHKNFIITVISSVFLLYTLTILDFLSIGSRLYLKESHGVKLENFNMIVFTMTTLIAQCVFGGLSRLRAGICGGAIFESTELTRKLHEFCETNTKTTSESLTNAYFAVMISTILYGLLSFLLGKYKMGKFFDYIPRTALYGVMASIGVGLIKAGFEEIYVGTINYLIHACALVTILIVLLAYYLEKKFPGYVFFIPLYSIAIVTVFYGSFYIFGFNLAWLRNNMLVPESEDIEISVSGFTKYLDFKSINFNLIVSCIPQILKLTLTNMIHITVNVPGFSSMMNIPANINEEFKVQGFANVATAFFGYPVYFINCTSLYFNKSGGTTKVHSILAGISLIGLIYLGPKAREVLPRILLAFIPIYIGGAFVISNIIENIPIVSYTDLFIIIISALVGLFDSPVMGLVIGSSLQAFIILHAYTSYSSNETEVYYNEVQKTYKRIEIDFIAFFMTYDKLIKKLSVKSPKILIDLRECPYIDHEANNILSSKIDEMDGEVLIVGSPINLYKDRFEKHLI